MLNLCHGLLRDMKMASQHSLILLFTISPGKEREECVGKLRGTEDGEEYEDLKTDVDFS